MLIIKIINVFLIIFSALLFLCACNTANTPVNTADTMTTRTVAVNKDTCAMCRGLSRAAMLNAKVAANDNKNNPVELTAATTATGDMVLIKGGSFTMGSADFPDAKPLHKVTVNSFYMDAHEVTNAQFAAFVKATGYVTVAEQKLNPADYPGIPVPDLVPGSAVFSPPNHAVSLNNPMQWWQYVAGANWKHPQGAVSTIEGKANYPVVQVCYTDAVAYAKWAGKRLPAEAEWEYAARAGRQNQKYYWGSELKPGGKWAANIFQGKFPYKNSMEDGYKGLAPVKSYPPNAFGLYDMDGNAWEWCSDFYRPDYYSNSSAANPQGPENSYDPDEPNVIKHVQRGGSFLCSDDYCLRYKAGSRGKGETNSASDNLGFRCVANYTPNKTN